MDEVCRVLETVSETGEGSDEELSASTQALKKLLVLMQGSTGEGELRVLARVLVAAAGHCGQHYWTNAVNTQLASEVLATLCTKYRHSDCESLLNANEDFLSAILDHLKEVLTKSSWKCYPVHKQGLVWVMKRLKHPNLAPHLPVFLPPTLWMLDDHSDYHRLLALSSVTHMIQQMDHTELRWQGRAELLYQAMKPLLYISNSSVVNALHPCLLKLLPVLDYCPTPTIPAKPKTTDQVFCILLDALAKESKISLQRAYTHQLKGYIYQLGIFSVRHLKQCLPLLFLGLGHSDPNKEDSRKQCLHALMALISCAWPRISSHKETILNALSKLVHDLGQATMDNVSSYYVQDDGMLDLVVQCLTLLMTACPELEEHQWLGDSHPTMQFCLQKALTQRKHMK